LQQAFGVDDGAGVLAVADGAGVVECFDFEDEELAVVALVGRDGADVAADRRRGSVLPGCSAGRIARAAASSISAIMREVAKTSGNESSVDSASTLAVSLACTTIWACPESPALSM
jgi:hypothetical protein